jgi:hypothetical protein
MQVPVLTCPSSQKCNPPSYSDTPADFLTDVFSSIRFALVWLTVMTLFPLSLLSLKFNRGRLPRTPQTPLSIIFAALSVALTVFAGNIAVDPRAAAFVTLFPRPSLAFLTFHPSAILPPISLAQ